MKTLFVIPEQATDEQLENQYLLCLAMLNFDHQVTVVFVGDSFTHIARDANQYKKWSALKLYGANPFYQLDPTLDLLADDDVLQIDFTEFETLKAPMDFIS